MIESPFLDKEWINSNGHAFAVRDGFPVSDGHTLILPIRVVSSIFDLYEYEYLDCMRLLFEEKKRLTREFKCTNFNVGINIGEAAGQTVAHAHIHLIPRFEGDHPNPRGGVRAVIPDKASY